MEAIVDEEYRLTLRLKTEGFDFTIFILNPDKPQYEDWLTFINCLKTNDEGRLTFDTEEGEVIMSTVKGKTSFTIAKLSWRNKVTMSVCLPNSVVKDAMILALDKLYK